MRLKTNEKYNTSELKEMYEKVCKDITFSAKLNLIYFNKKTSEIINTKMNNQLNSMEYSINRINPKFIEKSKSYEKIKEEMTSVLSDYENTLNVICNKIDLEINELILKRVELESKLLMEIIMLKNLEINNVEKSLIFKGIDTVVTKIKGNKKKKSNEISAEDEKKEKIEFIKKLEDDINDINKKIEEKDVEKENVVFSAMESENKDISTEIKKARTFKNIKRFFVNKFNTYNVIIKTVIEPLKYRIDEYKVNKIGKVNNRIIEININDEEEKIKQSQEKILDEFENKLIRKKLEI